MNLFFFKLYLSESQCYREKEGERGRQRAPICWPIPQMSAMAGNEQAEARNQELKTGLLGR